MPSCLAGHNSPQNWCVYCKAGSYRPERQSRGGAIGPTSRSNQPSDSSPLICPQCDLVADSWHSVYDHMIDKHPEIVVAAEVYQNLIDFSADLMPDEGLFQTSDSGDESRPTVTVPHGFILNKNNPEQCNICSSDSGNPVHILRNEPQGQEVQGPELSEPTPNRDWSSRYHFQGMSPRELEYERQRTVRKRKGLGFIKAVLATVVVGGIIGAAIAGGYFLTDNQGDEITLATIPSPPIDSKVPNSENPIPGDSPSLLPIVIPTIAPTVTPTIEPTPPMPTPTLTLNEIFEFNKSGGLSDDEAAQELTRRSSASANEIPTKIPIVVVVAMPTPTSTPAPEPTVTPVEIPGLNSRGSANWISALENEVHRLVNTQRQQNSLPALSQDSILAVVARGHSEDMALKKYFAHQNLAGQDPTDRGNVLGYTCRKDYPGYYTIGIGENIFQGWLYSSFTRTSRNYMTMEEIAFQSVDGWMNSPGHRENILTETYDREGIGVGIGSDESVYVTQNFC